MPDYVMIMMGSESAGDWDAYIEKLVASGKFRGGSSLAKGVALRKNSGDGSCEVTGFMRFTADDISEVRALVAGNPLFEGGGRIEVLEEVLD